MRAVLALFCGIVVASCSQAPNSSALPARVPADTQSRQTSWLVAAQTRGYERLYAFAGAPSDGAQPQAGLTSFGDRLYGTTAGGGKDGVGTIYALGNSNDETLLFSFPLRNNGMRPESRLAPMRGVLYGVSAGGGGTDCQGGCGTIFRLEASGVARVMYAFSGSNDGSSPIGDPIAVRGTLYGTTLTGGCSDSSCSGGCNCGTVFAFTPSGGERQLHSFSGPTSDGGFPVAGVTYADGALYGVTRSSAYKVSTRGVFQLLHQFGNGRDGFDARGTLLSFRGALYGTTAAGGSGCGTKGCGTIFELSLTGREKVLYRFKGGSDGTSPTAGLIAVNGVLYGTTELGGGCKSSASGCGTIFAVSTSGKERVLYRFGGGKDGKFPGRGSLLHVAGALYGTTEKGGPAKSGTIFELPL